MSFFDSLLLFCPLGPTLLAEMVLYFQNFTRIILILTLTFPLVLVSFAENMVHELPARLRPDCATETA